MNFLLTNDDGWGTNGLTTLEKVASKFGKVYVIAPDSPQSGISHRLTFESLLTLEERGPNSFALNGYPADCVRIGLTQMDVEFDWVLSGINHGANLGADIYVSGTVAAAREGWLQNVKSIGFSQFRSGGINQAFSWEPAEQLCERVLMELLEKYRDQPRCLVNVNFPDLERVDIDPKDVERVWCELDPAPLPTSYEKRSDGFMYNAIYRERSRTSGRDVDLCFGGKMAVCELE